MMKMNSLLNLMILVKYKCQKMLAHQFSTKERLQDFQEQPQPYLEKVISHLWQKDNLLLHSKHKKLSNILKTILNYLDME